MVEKLDKVSEIDYTLLSAPVCTASYVETNHKVLKVIHTNAAYFYLVNIKLRGTWRKGNE